MKNSGCANTNARLISLFIVAFSIFSVPIKAQIITTVAGGTISGLPATAVSIGTPKGVAVDSNGNIYFSDYENSQLYMVATSGVLSTYAGSDIWGYSGDGGPATLASIWGPTSIAIGNAGNVYFVDQDSHILRKINTSGIITSLGASFTTSAGIAADHSGNVFFIDDDDQIVIELKSTGGTITYAGSATLGPVYSGDGGQATDAGLEQPLGLAVDNTGNLFIACGNHVRKVDTTGIITTVAGSTTAGFSGDGWPATMAELHGASNVAVGLHGSLYISDQTNNRIRKIDSLGIIRTVVGTGVAGFGGDGGLATAALINAPESIAPDRYGNLILADLNNKRLRIVDTSGIIKTIIGGGAVEDGWPATYASLNSPNGICSDAAGNIYIADYLDHRVRKVDLSGIITTIAGTGISGYSGDGGPATMANLQKPNSVITDAAGNVYISDIGDERIRMVNAAGIISTFAGGGSGGDGIPATAANLNGPVGVTADGLGNIFIAESNHNCIRRVNSSGIISTYAGNGTAGYSGDGASATDAELKNPTGIAFDESGNLIIADNGNNCVRLVNSSGIISTIAGMGTAGYYGDGGAATVAELQSPYGVAADIIGQIYISDQGNNIIRKVNSMGYISTLAGNDTSGFRGDGGPATAAELHSPAGICIDATGNLLIADASNNRIRKVIVATGLSRLRNEDPLIKFYPNPTNNIVELISPIPVNVEIMTPAGQIVAAHDNARMLNLIGLSNGTYFLLFTDKATGHLVQTSRITKM